MIIPSTGKEFKRADIIQNPSDITNPNYATLSLYANNGFIIKVRSLYCGRDGEAMVDLLKYCGFQIEDITVYNILHREKMNITLWNKKFL